MIRSFDFSHTGRHIGDAVIQLATDYREIDIVSCSVRDYVIGGYKGERCRFMIDDGRELHLVPDMTTPDGWIFGDKTPERTPVEIGATLS